MFSVQLLRHFHQIKYKNRIHFWIVLTCSFRQVDDYRFCFNNHFRKVSSDQCSANTVCECERHVVISVWVVYFRVWISSHSPPLSRSFKLNITNRNASVDKEREVVSNYLHSVLCTASIITEKFIIQILSFSHLWTSNCRINQKHYSIATNVTYLQNKVEKWTRPVIRKQVNHYLSLLTMSLHSSEKLVNHKPFFDL